MSDPDQLCDTKGCEKAAIVHVTQIVNGQASHHYLCQSCADAKGRAVADVSAVLAQLGGGGPDSEDVGEDP